MRLLLVSLLVLFVAAPAYAGLDAAWRALPVRVPADSVPAVLLGWEQQGGPGVRPGEAAYALGQFHYARGEFDAAAGAWLRAVNRLDGDDRSAARYGWALASFALGRATAARAAFDEVARTGSGVRALAALGSAQCWEAEGHPEKALDALARLLAGDAGEATPPALERFAILAARAHREHDAESARRRLARDYPGSVEAARAQAAPPGAPPARPGPRLQTGAAPARKGRP